MTQEKQFSEKTAAVIDGLEFTKIFSCFQMAINPNKLGIAFAMVVLLAFFGVVFDFLSNSVVQMPIETARVYDKTVLPLFTGNNLTELDVYKAMPEYMDKFLSSENQTTRSGVFSTLYDHLAHSLNKISVSLIKFDMVGVFTEFGIVVRTFSWAFKYHTVYMVIYLFIFFCLRAICGGAICRGAALEICNAKRPSILENLAYGRRKFVDCLCAPLAPLALVLIFGSFISLTGFIGNLPWAGEIIMGILTIFSLLIGLVLVLILIGFLGGVHLMVPAVAVEGTDFNDAVSRSYCYAYSRPWLLGFYGIVAAIYGAVCYMFIRLCAFMLLGTTYVFLSFGMFADSSSKTGVDKLHAIWPQPQFFNLTGNAIAVNFDWSEHFSHLLVSLSVLIISGMVAAFVISFYFTSCTVIYTLCRKAIDKDPISVINDHNS